MKPRRTHTFDGCRTCRQRHVKCDQTLPQCHRCRVAGRTCDFTPRLRWLVSTGRDVYDRHMPSKDEAQFSRRHLYTEEYRATMSLSIAKNLPSTVSSALSEVEQRSETMRETDRHRVGPFGVFRANSMEATNTNLQTTPVSNGDATKIVANLEPEGAEFFFANQSLFNDHSASLDFLQWDDLFTSDLQLDDSLLTFYSPPKQQLVDGSPEEVDLGNAPALLKHFHDNVIQQMGSLPVKEKSSWRTLNFNSALVTLGQLRLLEMTQQDVRHASLANLYALMAVSSFHLSLNLARFTSMSRTDSYWANASRQADTMSKKHLRMSLDAECEGPNKAKYKDQIMATAAILGLALLSGNENDSSRYLNEMERLIRTRGLVKPKISRRARLLHNVYAWMRIISESTHVIERSSERKRIDTDHYGSQAREDSALDNFLQMEPWQMGAQDIHLANANDDTENMYMQIYGVPETWLRLVSQITRLANMMDRLQPRQKRWDAELLAALQPKASQLEEAVCNFHARYKVATGTTPHDHMVRALSSGLMIFFYRRIRDAPSDLMQDSVSHVVSSLHEFDASLEGLGLPGPGTAWPAFVAGSEANSDLQREQIRAWLQKAFTASGWRGYQLSTEIMSEIWSTRDAGREVTWVEICRMQKLWPLLC